MLERNELCRDRGLTQVCYSDECRDQAAKYLGLENYPFAVINNNSTNGNVPKGCHVLGEGLFHNIRGGDRHPDAAPICWIRYAA